MHEDDPDVAAYQEWLKECFNLDETFTLEIGEACRIRDEYVDKLPAPAVKNGFNYGDGRFKLMYKRTDDDAYHWLDSEGNQGVDRGPLEFYVKHWEKVE